MPTLTIVTSAYNAARYMQRMLDSVAPLLAHDVEFVVVNDGSTDGTGAILAQFAKEHPGVVVIEQPNAGVSAARNTATLQAHGDYIWYCDADDRLYPDKVAQLLATVRALEQRPDMVVCNALKGAEGAAKQFGQVPQRLDNTTAGVQQWYALFAGLGEICFYWYKRSIVLEHQLRFSSFMMEDWHFHIKFVRHVRHIFLSSSTLYRYYINPGSATQTSNWRARRLSTMNLAIDLLHDIERNPSDRPYCDWVAEQCNKELLMIFREASPAYVDELWALLQQSGVKPLRMVRKRAWLHRNLELFMLNHSLAVFRAYSRLRVKPIW